MAKSNITRKIVGSKVYTYNSGKLIHVTDRGTGTGTGTNNDITKTTKQQNNTVKNTNKSNKNADGTWKNQTMVTGAYFGNGSKKQQNTVKETKPKYTAPTVPGLQAPQLQPVSVSGNKNKSDKSNGTNKKNGKIWKNQTPVTGDYFGTGSKKKENKPVLETPSVPGLSVPALGSAKVKVGGGSLREAESYGALYGQMKGRNTGKKTDKSGNIGPYDTKGLQTKAQNIKNSKTDWAQVYASQAQVAKDVDAKYEVTQQIQKEMDDAGYTKAEQKQMWAQIEKESGFKPQTKKSAFSRIDNLTTDKKIVSDIQKAQVKNAEELEKDSKELQNLSKAHSKSLNDAYANRKAVRNSPNLEERSKGQKVKSGSIIGEAVKKDPGLLSYIKKLAYSKSYYTDKEKQDAVTAWRMLTNGDRRQNAEALGMSLNDYNSLAATLSMRAREIEQGAYAGMAAIIPGYDYMQGGLDTENFNLQKYLNGGFDPGTYYSKEEQKQIANNLQSMQTAKQIGGTIGTVVSMLMMNYGTSAIASAASKGLKAATSAGKISQRTSNLILQAASKTGMPTALTFMSASRKGYDWDNFGTDWLKNMIMLNVMGASESKISGALKGLLSNSKYATSNLAMTGVKVASSAGGAGAGVLSTVPLNTKEENERLGEQWATLTLYSVFNNVIGGLKNSPKQVEAGMADILNSEAEYKAALKEYIQNENIEGAIEHARNARALHDQGKEILVGKNSEMMYGFNKSQKQQLLDAYDQIGQGLANLEIDLMADLPGSGIFGSNTPSYKGSVMALPAGAGSEQVALDNIKTPVLDQYTGGKAVMDGIIGRQTAPADTMPTIAKYGGAEVASQAAIAANPKSVNPVRAAADVPMISKYSGNENVADEASVAIVSSKIRPQLEEGLKSDSPEVTINVSDQEITLPKQEASDLYALTGLEADNAIDVSMFTDAYDRIINTGKLITDLNTSKEGYSISDGENNKVTLKIGDSEVEVSKDQADDLSIILSNYRKGAITIDEAESSIREVMNNAQIEETIPGERTSLLYNSGRPTVPIGSGGDNASGSIGEEPGENEGIFEFAERGASENIDRRVVYERLNNVIAKEYGYEDLDPIITEDLPVEKLNNVKKYSEQGIRVIYVKNGPDGQFAKYIRAKNSTSKGAILISIDAPDEHLVHEVEHDSIALFPEKTIEFTGDIARTVGENLFADALNQVLDAYWNASERNNTVKKYYFSGSDAEIHLRILNETICDIVAGINREGVPAVAEINNNPNVRALVEKHLSEIEKLKKTKAASTKYTDYTSDLDGYYSVKTESNSEPDNRKRAQLDIIQRNNPITDDVHTGIRTIDDIKTYNEIVSNPNLDEEFTNPDWTLEDAEKAIKDGKLTVYSSYPIKDGVFVTPSKMMAQDYAGSGQVYSDEMDPNNVAWINGDEGQVAATTDSTQHLFNPDDELEVKLNASIPILKYMEPVSHLSGNEFKKSSVSLIDQVVRFFNKLGNTVTRNGFGDVELKKRGAKASVGHGIGRAKAAAFATVPDVIKYGKQIDYQQNWDDRGYDTYVFAAPVTVGESNDLNYVGVVVNKYTTRVGESKFYLHEILDQNGNRLVWSDESEVQIKNTEDHQDRLGETANLGKPTVLSNDKVAQNKADVNTLETPTAEEFQQTMNEAANEPAPVIKPQLKSKLSKQYDKAVKEFTDNAFNLMNVPNKKNVQAELKASIADIAANAFENGAVDDAAVTDLISRMWDAGAIYENPIQDTYPDLKPYFNKTAIKVSDAIQRDITDYNAWRKSQMGNLNITHNTGTPVDAVYQELSARYPALFPEDIINPTEQLMRMAEVRQQMRGTTRSNSDLYTDEQRVEIASMANKLVDTLEKKLVGIAAESRGEAIPGYSPENLASLDAQDPLNQDPDWISLQQQEPVVETEGEKLKNWKETKRRVSLTSQVLDMTRRVQKAAKTAQPELRAKMIEEFGTIVPYFKGMSDGKRIDLKKQIDDLDRFRREVPGAKQYVWDAETGTYKQDDPIMKIMTQLNGKLVAEMSNDELYQLFKNGQMLMHQYRTAKKEIREQGARDINDLGDTLVKQMKTAGPKTVKDNNLADFITVKMLSPDTFAKEVDGYAEDGVMQRMFEGIREGQTKYMDFRNRAYDLLEDFKEKHKKFIDKNWRGKKQTVYDTGVVPINGTETLKMTAGTRIALYLNSLDYDAMRHMVGGQYRGDDGKMHTYDGEGITVPNQMLWEKGKLEEAYNAGKNYKVTEKMVQRIIDTMTPEEKEWADLVFKKIYNGICPTEANEVSLALDGWERFIKKNYYRIITDENYTQTVFESLVNDITVEGQGFTKERQKGAHNPILLVDAFNALDSHIDGVAKYIGYAAPMRNIMKVLNYNDGTASVKASLNERMGSAGMRYIEKYITDMQGGGKKSKDGMIFSKARSGYAGATLTMNPGVVFMQAASIPTAAAYLGWNNMRGIFRKVDGDTVKKYSVYYRYRSKGNYTADFDDLTKNKTMLDRLPLFNWIQQMDNAAVKSLWGACECYVEEHFPNLKKGSEEYLKKVGETLDKCVSLTQPNYTTAERPDVMRTDSDFLKIFTMFKTQPFQNLNLGWSATRNVQYKLKAYNQAKREGRDGKKEKEELKKAWKGLGRTASALTVAAVMIAAIRGVSEMIKGRWDNFTDENGEFSLDGLFNYIGKETGGSLAGSVIGGNELYSFISSLIDENSNYYDISAPQLSVINDFTSALKNMYDVFSAVTSGDRSPKALFRSSEKLAETIGTMFGVPIANVRKYIGGIIGNFSPEFKAEYEDLMYGVDPSDVKNASGQGWGSFLFGGMADTDAYFNKVFENRNGKGITTENRDEIKRLYLDFKDITGDVNGMFLSDPDQYKYNGIKYDLKEDDKKAIREMAQAEIATNINKLMESRAFAGLTDEQKIKAIKELTSYAADTARNEWLSNHNQSVDKGKDFDKVGYALFKASVNDDMTTAEKKQTLLDLNFNDYTTASIYEKAFEDKSTKEENSIAYKMEHTSKSAAEIIRESMQEKAEKEKSAKESVVNNSATKIKEAEGYTLPNFRASTLQAIADIGISPEDYAYVSDRLDGHDDKVDYINSLPFDKKTKQGLVDDLIMGDKAHDKMKIAQEDYNIPNSTYIDTYMYGYESTGSKKERNQKIQAYVNDLPGLNDSQKDYLYWANQVYRKKEAVGSGESGAASVGYESGSGSKSSSGGGRRSGRRRSSGGGSSGGSGGSSSTGTTIPEAQGYATPKYRKDKLAKISDMGLSPSDYAYVTDRVASTDNKVGYIKSLNLGSKATQGLINDLVMDANGRRKMTVGTQDYGIPANTYTQAFMYAYETTGSKAERNAKIKAYVNAIPGLDSKQKTYLSWAVQANKSNGQTEGSGGSSGRTSSAKVSVKAAPSISRKSVSSIGKSAVSKYIAGSVAAKAKAQKNADYAAQVKNIDSNVFMTAKQKAAAKRRLKAALGE